MFARSKCPQCSHLLSFLDLVPIISWLILRRHCRYCASPIETLYPVMEIGAAGIALWALFTVETSLLPVSVLLGWALIALSAIDLRHLILPDAVTLPLIAAGIGATALHTPDQIIWHIAGAAGGYASLWCVRYIYRQIRNTEGLGLGDVKLFAAIGAWVGIFSLPTVLLLSSIAVICGTLMVSLFDKQPLAADARIPFGPGLALGGWLAWLYGPI